MMASNIPFEQFKEYLRMQGLNLPTESQPTFQPFFQPFSPAGIGMQAVNGVRPGEEIANANLNNFAEYLRTARLNLPPQKEFFTGQSHDNPLQPTPDINSPWSGGGTYQPGFGANQPQVINAQMGGGQPSPWNGQGTYQPDFGGNQPLPGTNGPQQMGGTPVAPAWNGYFTGYENMLPTQRNVATGQIGGGAAAGGGIPASISSLYPGMANMSNDELKQLGDMTSKFGMPPEWQWRAMYGDKQMAMQQAQFAQTFPEQQRQFQQNLGLQQAQQNIGQQQFGQSLANTQYQFGQQFPEQQRQYQQNLALQQGAQQIGQQQFGQQFGEGQRQYNASLEFQRAQAAQNQGQFTASQAQNQGQFAASQAQQQGQFGQNLALQQAQQNIGQQQFGQQFGLAKQGQEFGQGISTRQQAQAEAQQAWQKAMDQWNQSMQTNQFDWQKQSTERQTQAGLQQANLGAFGRQIAPNQAAW